MPNSPDFIRVSLAAAMTLGLRPGIFWRDAKLYCINLLTVYDRPCAGNCAYCGLHRQRRPPKHAPRETKRLNRPDKTFIRVDWPAFPTELVVERIVEHEPEVPIKRVCISMITRREAVEDTITIAKMIREVSEVPISMLIAPTVIRNGDLERMKEAGADKIGVAIDAATPELFDRLRGKGQNAPHRWDRYWQVLENARDVFGKGNIGAHFIVGLGETEKDMVYAFQRARDLGGETHLFSFYPEEGSDLEHLNPPPIDQYRRMQIARFLIDEDIARAEDMEFDENGRLIYFGISSKLLDEVIESGTPFMTSGCKGKDGTVACNRPYANSRPGPRMRNYPFPPTKDDIELIRAQLETGEELPFEVEIS